MPRDLPGNRRAFASYPTPIVTKSRGVAEQLTQVISERAGYLSQVGIARGCLKNLVCPHGAADDRDRITEGRLLLLVPGRPLDDVNASEI